MCIVTRPKTEKISFKILYYSSGAPTLRLKARQNFPPGYIASHLIPLLLKCVSRKKKMVELTSYTTDNLIADNAHENFEKHQLLQSLIRELNSVEKSIILLYLEEKTYQEIAYIMGMSKTNVSVRLVRIKKKLEEIFKQQTK